MSSETVPTCMLVRICMHASSSYMITCALRIRVDTQDHQRLRDQRSQHFRAKKQSLTDELQRQEKVETRCGESMQRAGEWQAVLTGRL